MLYTYRVGSLCSWLFLRIRVFNQFAFFGKGTGGLFQLFTVYRIGVFFISVVTSYEKSFGSSSLRSCYWAIESAFFVKRLLTLLVDEESLPTDLDIRGWLFVDVNSYVVSATKLQALIASFSSDENLTEDVAVYEEDVSRVPNFLLSIVRNVLLLPGICDDLAFVRSVFSSPRLVCVAETDLVAEIRNFTGLLVEMGRISLVEQDRMELGFLEFIRAFRCEPRPAGATAEYSAVDLLRCCSSRGSQSLLRLVFCLGGVVQSTCNTICEGIGHLPSDVMSCVCAVISGYLSANHVRSYGSVSGPLLEEVMESHRRLVDLSEITEGMLWDDVGIVAGEDYRLQLYASLGYDVTGERAASPEIGN